MFEVFRQLRTGRRRTLGGYVGGFAQPATTSMLVFTASVQPASSDAIQLLPEGRRLTGSVMVFTKSDLKVAGATFNSDLLLHNGLVYECMAQMPWGNNIINHKAYVFSVVPDLTELPEVTP